MDKYLRLADGVQLVSGCVGCNIDFYLEEYPEDKIARIASQGDAEIVWLYLPDSVETVGDKAFEGCYGLKTVFLPKRLKHIGWNAFWGCDIENVYYPGSVLDYEKAEGGGGKPNFHFFHCKEGTLDFSREVYIHAFPFQGTMEKWRTQYADHWLNRRAEKIICTDGIIDCGE